MVRGLDIFRERFREYADRYVLIGGAACDLAMSAADLTFRATKDLDIVLCVEALDAAFAQAFWSFVRDGGYQVQEKASGRRQFYRFQKPAAEGYPFMLELFSVVPDALTIADESHLTPIPFNDEASSLSAILLDSGYYAWIHAGKQENNGMFVVRPEYLVALKARAWLDLSGRKAKGKRIDSRDVKKHRNDVVRLFPLLAPAPLDDIPGNIKADMAAFLDALTNETLDLKALGITSRSLPQFIAALRVIYCMDL